MRIAFVDFVNWDYTIDTPRREPLGGSQSALCYLAEELAKVDQEIFLINGASRVGVSRGVTTVPLAKAQAELWSSLDVAVVQNYADGGPRIRQRLGPLARLVLWTQHADDQPAMRSLDDAQVRDSIDRVAFVSDWQRASYERRFGIDPRRSAVLRNAVSPNFIGLFADGENILPAKMPGLLAYTSTPFRGLDVLVDAMPAIRAEVPEARLEVYSSMGVYRMSAQADAQRFGELYEKCRQTAGVEYIGSRPQAELAACMKRVSLLAYPNHFAETSCIAVMEALAAGCRVVTSDLGALAETCMGFGRLVTPSADAADYRQRFTADVVAALRELRDNPQKCEEQLAEQVAAINAQCNWPARAGEWLRWLRAN